MKKSTRRAFSRKAVSLAVCLFVVAALITTGFAAWLLSNDSQDSVTGNVTASTVNDQSLSVSITNKDSLGTIKFAPDKNDNAGAIRYDASKPDDFENLSVTVEASFNNFDHFKSLDITVNVSDAVLKAAGYTWTEGASRTYTYKNDTTTPAYIRLPEYVRDKDGNKLGSYPTNYDVSKEVRTITYNETAKTTTDSYYDTGANKAVITASETDQTATVTFKVEFGWGEYFGKVNPGYDGNGSDNPSTLEKKILDSVTQEEKNAAMTEISRVLNDMKTKLTHVDDTNIVNYNIILAAKAK